MKTIKFELPNGQGWHSIDVPEDMPKDEILRQIDSLVGSYNKSGTSVDTTGVEDPTKFSESYKLARNKSPLQAAMISAGREFDALGTGTRMLWNKLTGDQDEYDKLVAENKAKNELMAPLRDEHGVATAVGGTLPYLAASPSIALGAGRMAGSMIPQALKMTPVLPQAINTALTGGKVANALAVQGQNRLLQSGVGSALTAALRDPVKQGAVLGGTIGALHADDTALTGALQGGVAAGLGKVLFAPFSKKTTYLTDSQQKIVKEAQELGIYLTPGTKTGDLRLGQLDRRFADNPAVSSLFQARQIENNAKISQHLSRQLGLPSTSTMGADYLYDGFRYYGNIMDEVASRSKVVFDKNDVIKLYDVIKDYNKYPGTSKLAGDWKDYLYKSLGVKTPKFKGGKKAGFKWNFSGGQLPGKEYQEISTRLNQQIAANMYTKGGDRSLGEVLVKVKNILDDSLEKGAHPADVDLLKFARKGYQGLELVRKSTDANSGMIDLQKLYQNMTNKNVKSQYNRIRGEGLFPKLARIGKLQQETRAKVDLATANISRSLLNESPAQLRSVYKLASMGLGEMDYRTLLPKIRTNLYLSKSGWPAATGMLPVIKPETADRLQKLFARATMGDSTPEENTLQSLWE